MSGFKWFLVISLTLMISVLITTCARDEESFSQAARSRLIRPAKWWENLPRPVYLKLEKVETSQDWYEVYKLLDNTYAIYEPYQFEEAICYLLIGEEKALMVDTGTGIGDLKKVVAGLTSLPVSVVNTHVHWDQIGNNSQFDEILIFNNLEGITKLYTGFDNDFLRAHIFGESVWKPLPAGFDPGTWKTPPVKATRLLEDGMVLDLGNRPLEVIYTPGHSPDSICLLDKNSRLLFTGDLYYSGPLYAFEEDVSVDNYMSSLEKLLLRSDEFDHLCPAHNEPWVKSDVLQQVLDAFKEIMRGKGLFEESENIRRYYFDDFDIIISKDVLKKQTGE